MADLTNKDAAMKLEAEYVQLRKERSESKRSRRTRVFGGADCIGTDPDGLFSTGMDSGSCSCMKPSRAVTIAEKKALQFLFSVSTLSLDSDDAANAVSVH